MGAGSLAAFDIGRSRRTQQQVAASSPQISACVLELVLDHEVQSHPDRKLQGRTNATSRPCGV